MLRAISGRRFAAVLVVTALAWFCAPASAQSTGAVKGKVVDAQGQAVEGAKVLIDYTDGMNRKYEVKTNKKGEYIQIGLQVGNYRLTADKKDLGSQSFDVRVRLGATAEINFQLNPANVPAMSREDTQKLQAFKAAFDAGVTENQAGNNDAAIARFTEALTMRPDCYACQYNIGSAYTQKQDYAKAEEAFKKAIELKPDSAEPYNALANVYNSEKRFEEAAKMTEEATKRASLLGATGGGNADSLFNQGVIFWNAGKIPEAKKQFEEAVKVNPAHAESHYWLGMAGLNEGKMPEAVAQFEEYLKLAPTGQYADQAKGIVSQLKK
jgi:tetratricopeptide (TPR) repeat protein